MIALLLGAVLALAESFDGTYTGTITCPAFPGQQPLRGAISVIVAERRATYELELIKPVDARRRQTGSYERGDGTVTPAGAITLSGGCEGGFSCATAYSGDLTARPIRLTGTQRWWFRGGDRERACQIELTRAGS